MGIRETGCVALAWIALTLSACDPPATAESTAAEAAKPPAKPSEKKSTAEVDLKSDELLIGEFRTGPDPVVDGDTVRALGFDSAIRLIALDAEERFHGKADRAAATRNYDAYLKEKRGDGSRPRKFGTPMGEEATRFAKAFFEGVEEVRLERDDPKEIRGYFGRPLAYVLAKKDGRWVHYNVECVRAGMSPYFTKYGYSRRFHKEFLDAEAEAKRKKRGIWNPSAKSYRDYDVRRKWWDARADFIRAFEHDATGEESFILFSHYDGGNRLESLVGQDVTVLSTVDRITRFENLIRVSLATSWRRKFPLIFFDEPAFVESGIDGFVKEPVRVRGRVERYSKGTFSTLQIVVDRADQVMLPELPPTN